MNFFVIGTRQELHDIIRHILSTISAAGHYKRSHEETLGDRLYTGRMALNLRLSDLERHIFKSHHGSWLSFQILMTSIWREFDNGLPKKVNIVNAKANKSQSVLICRLERICQFDIKATVITRWPVWHLIGTYIDYVIVILGIVNY